MIFKRLLHWVQVTSLSRSLCCCYKAGAWTLCLRECLTCLLVLVLQSCAVLLVDILDMEDELLLPHFEACIQFLERFLTRNMAVLVHCVYGQSRSAAICVAYVMATQDKTLLEAYDIVQRARPCISINTGFLRQLDLFEKMRSDPNCMGSTAAHAELRTMMAQQQRRKTGAADVVGTLQLTQSGSSVCCRKCNHVLCTTSNQVRRRA